MSVLESVLNYKRQKDAEARADIDAIPAGINAFVAAKQQAEQQVQKSLLDELTLKVSAAKGGFDIDTKTGTLKRNPEYLNAQSQEPVIFDPNTGQYTDVEGNPVQSIQKGQTVRNKALSIETMTERARVQREQVTENPSIDNDTQKAIAGYEFAEPRIKRIESVIDSGELGDDETFKKLTSEILIKGTGPTARYVVKDGSPLEGLMSDLNAIKTTGFSIAGTAYTPTERETIEYGLDPRGKSTKQFKQDVRIVQDYLVSKAKAGTMGLKEAREKVSAFQQSMSNSKQEDKTEILIDPNGVKRKVSVDKVDAAIKAGFKRGK